MTTINKLTRTDVVTAGDVIPVYVQNNGDARGASMSVILTYIQTSFTPTMVTFLATPTSANLAAAVNDETGTGSLVFATSPTLVTPNIGAALATSLQRGSPVTKTTSFAVAAAENWIICNGGASITATLPSAAAFPGREIMLKNIAAFTVVSASANVVPLAGGAAGTAILAAVAGRWSTLVSDGTNWITMQGV
jgi:hypothetical protein